MVIDDIKHSHHGNSEHDDDDDALDDVDIDAEALHVIATNNKSGRNIYRGPKGKYQAIKISFR